MAKATAHPDHRLISSEDVEGTEGELGTSGL
jgi:hypothetical protein